MDEKTLKELLHAIGKERGIQFNVCRKQFFLERFLVRLTHSPHANKFIFKGGFLLSYMMEIGRETTDLDFLLTRMKAEKKNLQRAFEEIASVPSHDGVVFSFDTIELLSQPHMEYPGYRTNLQTAFGTIKDRIQIDLGIGDVVNPQQQELQLFQHKGKSFFEETISLLVYPPETIFAEKLETVLLKSFGNTRMKDYHDLLLLIREKKLPDRQKLSEAILKTFSHRGTRLRSIQFPKAGINLLQKNWAKHLKDLEETSATNLHFPKEISSVIEEINRFYNPLSSRKK